MINASNLLKMTIVTITIDITIFMASMAWQGRGSTPMPSSPSLPLVVGLPLSAAPFLTAWTQPHDVNVL